MSKGVFISVEGTDGSGKTTQLTLLKEYLENVRDKVIFLREPGGTKIGESIRNILLSVENMEMSDRTEALLYAAARAQIIDEVIRPKLDNGYVVVCDRFVDSSYAYQGFARNLGYEKIKGINDFATNDLMPDLTVFLDISPEVALERRKQVSEVDRLESQKDSFYDLVYNGYKEMCNLYPERIKSVDATRTIDEIADEIKKIVEVVL